MKNFEEKKVENLSTLTGGKPEIEICFTINFGGFFNGNLKDELDEFDKN